jgi:hypothetical protein
VKVHGSERVDVEEVDPGGVDLSAENGGQSEGMYRTVDDDVENSVDLLTGISLALQTTRQKLLVLSVVHLAT